MKSLQTVSLFNVISNLDKSSCDSVITLCEERKKQILNNANTEIKLKINHILDTAMTIKEVFCRDDFMKVKLENREYCFWKDGQSFIEGNTTTVMYYNDNVWTKEVIIHTYEKSIPNGYIEPLIDQEAIRFAKLKDYRKDLCSTYISLLDGFD